MSPADGDQEPDNTILKVLVPLLYLCHKVQDPGCAIMDFRSSSSLSSPFLSRFAGMLDGSMHDPIRQGSVQSELTSLSGSGLPPLQSPTKPYPSLPEGCNKMIKFTMNVLQNSICMWHQIRKWIVIYCCKCVIKWQMSHFTFKEY